MPQMDLHVPLKTKKPTVSYSPRNLPVSLSYLGQ